TTPPAPSPGAFRADGRMLRVRPAREGSPVGDRGVSGALGSTRPADQSVDQLRVAGEQRDRGFAGRAPLGSELRERTAQLLWWLPPATHVPAIGRVLVGGDQQDVALDPVRPERLADREQVGEGEDWTQCLPLSQVLDLFTVVVRVLFEARRVVPVAEGCRHAEIARAEEAELLGAGSQVETGVEPVALWLETLEGDRDAPVSVRDAVNPHRKRLQELYLREDRPRHHHHCQHPVEARWSPAAPRGVADPAQEGAAAAGASAVPPRAGFRREAVALPSRPVTATGESEFIGLGSGVVKHGSHRSGGA